MAGDQNYNGGWAFPTMRSEVGGGWEGMTLRDWFAGQTLPYLTEFHGQFLYCPDGPRDIAQMAYTIADAMLAERAKGGA